MMHLVVPSWQVIKPGLDSALDSGLYWTQTKLRAVSDNKKKGTALLSTAALTKPHL